MSCVSGLHRQSLLIYIMPIALRQFTKQGGVVCLLGQGGHHINSQLTDNIVTVWKPW